MDIESTAYDDEWAPDIVKIPKDFPEDQVVDDPNIRDTFVPGGPLDGTTPSIFSFGGSGVSGSDNGAFSWEPESGSVFYSALSFSPMMVFDWISNIGFRDIRKSNPLTEFGDFLAMHRISRDEAVALLKEAAITKQRDLWKIVSTPCSSLTTDIFNSPSECVSARRGIRILAWRFFSSDSTTFYPVRQLRLRTDDPEEKRILGIGADEIYSSVKYFNGVVTPIDAYNPMLTGGEDIE